MMIIIVLIMIIATIVMMMMMVREDPTMMRNGCLTLCQFNIPQDVLFDYERLVKIMMMMMMMRLLSIMSMVFMSMIIMIIMMTTMMMMICMNTDSDDQVRILLHIVSEHTSEENNFIQVPMLLNAYQRCLLHHNAVGFIFFLFSNENLFSGPASSSSTALPARSS